MGAEEGSGGWAATLAAFLPEVGEGFPGVSGIPRWYVSLALQWPSQLVGVSGKGVVWAALVLQLFLPLGLAVSYWSWQNWREYRALAAAAWRRARAAVGRRPVLTAVASAAGDVAVDLVSLPWNLVQAALGEDSEEILAEGRARLAQGVAGAARLLRRPGPWPRRAQALEVGPAPAPAPALGRPATAPPREGHTGASRAASLGAAGPNGAALQQKPAPRRVSGL